MILCVVTLAISFLCTNVFVPKVLHIFYLLAPYIAVVARCTNYPHTGCDDASFIFAIANGNFFVHLDDLSMYCS